MLTNDIINVEQLGPDVNVPILSSPLQQVTGGKHKKNRKKKDKSKQLLTLEVNFSDRKEETLLGENSVIEEEKQDKVIKKPK